MSLVFDTSDREHFDRCREILDQLGIEASEIASEALVTEQTQVASVNQGRQTVELENVREGKRFAAMPPRLCPGLVVWAGARYDQGASNRLSAAPLHLQPYCARGPPVGAQRSAGLECGAAGREHRIGQGRRRPLTGDRLAYGRVPGHPRCLCAF